MSLADREKIEANVREWMSGAGMGIVVPTVLLILMKLVRMHGDGVTIDGACEALDEAARVAGKLASDLRK